MTAARGEQVAVIAGVRLACRDRMDPFGDDPVDVHLADGIIVDIAPAGALPRRGLVFDGEGGWLVPGLWDHHVHMTTWSLAAQREPLGHAASAEEAARLMATAPARADDRRVGAGFRDGLWPDRPSLDLLDTATGQTPTYLVNADLHSVWLNSVAFRREGYPLDPTGVLREAEAFAIQKRLDEVATDAADRLVSQAAAAAAARGVVGLVDLDMRWNAEAWARRFAGGFDALRVEFGMYPEHLDRALAEGLRTGEAVPGVSSDLLRVGPFKVITDGSLGTRTAACSHAYPGDPHNHGMLTVPPDELRQLMTRATAGGLSCAVHAIGDLANTHALDAFAATGAWGTIEHAQLVAHVDIPRFARLGVGASVQPEHALDDRDLTDTIWAEQTALAYPLRALADAGATLLFGSDAPVGALDPWVAMAAAVFRTRDEREPWQPGEAVDAATALAASTRGGSGVDAAVIAPGAVADLVLCAQDPLTADEKVLRTMPVAATLLAGRVTHVA